MSTPPTIDAAPAGDDAPARHEEVVFEVRDLRVSALRDDGTKLPIVKGVDFRVRRGEVTALIGESGSGKTTISLSALGYCKPGLVFDGGEALLLGQDVTKMSTDELRPIRGIRVAYLAQSAAATFNPSIRINEQVTEAAVLHGTRTQAEADAKALELYRALELPDPERIGERYPHQVSGGQLQRLMAAMALCGEPDLLVLDEPTTALDVTTQVEVLKAFKRVIAQQGAAALYVTHDLAVVAQVADRIVVLYDGETQEAGPVGTIIDEPLHPYTQRLMAAIKPLPGGPRAGQTPTAKRRGSAESTLDAAGGLSRSGSDPAPGLAMRRPRGGQTPTAKRRDGAESTLDAAGGLSRSGSDPAPGLAMRRPRGGQTPTAKRRDGAESTLDAAGGLSRSGSDPAPGLAMRRPRGGQTPTAKRRDGAGATDDAAGGLSRSGSDPAPGLAMRRPRGGQTPTAKRRDGAGATDGGGGGVSRSGSDPAPGLAADRPRGGQTPTAKRRDGAGATDGGGGGASRSASDPAPGLAMRRPRGGQTASGKRRDGAGSPDGGGGVYRLGSDPGRQTAALEAIDITAGYGGTVDGQPVITVLRDVNVAIGRGEAVGVIGESGCGKSTLARVFAGLLPPARGELRLDGAPLAPEVASRSRNELRKVQFVYQMADTALNPRQRIRDIIGRPLTFYAGLRGAARRARVEALLDMVELPASFADRLPHELSGGQKQRVNLARALAAEPEVVLCDEVTSALDTIVGANVIELLKRLRRDTGVSFVFISHDLSTVASFADRIVVLYAGRVAEQGTTSQVLSLPNHPYTQLLMSSVPEMRVGWLEDTTRTDATRRGLRAGVELVQTGCPFFARCPLAIPGTCDTMEPSKREAASGHIIECHRELQELGGS